MTAAHARLRLGVALLAGLAVLGATPAAAELVPPTPPLVAGAPPAGWPAPPADTVSASAWLLMDAQTGQRLAEHDADESRPVASTVKILTALTAAQRSSPDEEVTVGDEVLVGGASVGLRPGDAWTVRQLLEAVLIRSGNDAAEALATHVAGDTAAFVELMRADARALGLDGLELHSPSGLEDANRLSALHLATLARAALAEPDLRPLLALEEARLPVDVPLDNRNELLESYPGATGVKTGFTLASGNCLVASAQRNGRELIAVVLDAGDDPARFAQAAELLDLGFAAFEPHQAGVRLEVATAGGWHEYVAAPAPVTAPTDSPVTIDVDLPTWAPEGAVTGELLVDGEPLTSVALADTADEPASASSATARLGAALVDGAYASLRAASTAEPLR